MINWKQRYQQVHEHWFKQNTPQTYDDGHYCTPKYPDVRKANGLTLAVCNFVNWSGYRATRISTTGRQVGVKWIYGNTRKGTADISLTIKGMAVQIEIKVGADRASEHQLKEQAKERAAGGVYEFVSTMEQFIEFYDAFLGIK